MFRISAQRNRRYILNTENRETHFVLLLLFQIMTNVLQVTRVTAAPRVKIQMDRMHAPVTTATLEMDAPVEVHWFSNFTFLNFACSFSTGTIHSDLRIKVNGFDVSILLVIITERKQLIFIFVFVFFVL